MTEMICTGLLCEITYALGPGPLIVINTYFRAWLPTFIYHVSRLVPIIYFEL